MQLRIRKPLSQKGENMKKKKNSRKSVRWSAVPVPCLRRLCLKLKGEQGSGSKGSMTYAFTQGDFLLLLILLGPPPLPPGPYLSLEAHILALRPKSQS